jgi:hypothetical protein
MSGGHGQDQPYRAYQAFLVADRRSRQQVWRKPKPSGREKTSPSHPELGRKFSSALLQVSVFSSLHKSEIRTITEQADKIKRWLERTIPKFDNVKKRFERTNPRFDNVKSRFERTNPRFDNVKGRFE